MPGAQQIALNLVAQLDQGNIQSQASQMASTMARAIEDAFQGLGERIAGTIVAGVRQGLQGSVELIGATQTERQMLATAHAQAAGILPGAAPGAPGAPGVPGGVAYPSPSMFTTTQGGFFMPAQAPGAGPAPGGEPEPAPLLSTRMRRQAAGALGAFGTALSLGGELPGIMRRSEAAGAELEGMPGRTFMRGDIEGLMAQQRVGGTEEMEARASREQGMIMAGEIAGAIALALAPLTGGASLVAGAAALGLGADVVRRGVGFKSEVLQNVQEQTEAERQRSFEFMQATEAGRETGIRAFRGGQAAGVPELAPFMAGGFPSTMGGMSMRQFGIQQANLSPEMFESAMGQFAKLPGGQQMRQSPEAVQRALSDIGMGFGNLPQVAGGMAGGGASGVDAITRAADVWEDAVAAGVDRAQAGQVLMRMGQQAESMGLGGAGVASRMTEATVAAAQGLHRGGGDISGAEMADTGRGMEFFRTQGMGMQGMQFAARAGAMRGFERQHGMRLRGQEELELMRQEVTPEGLQMMAERRLKEGHLGRGERSFFQQVQKDPAAMAAQLQNQLFQGTEKQMRAFSPFAETQAAMGIVPEGMPMEQFERARRMERGVAGGQITPTGRPGVAVGTGAMPADMDQAAQMRQLATLTASKDAMVVTEGLNTLAQQMPALIQAVKNANQKLQQQVHPTSSPGFSLQNLFGRGSSPGGG